MPYLWGAKQYNKEDDFLYYDETNNMFSNDTQSIKDLKFHSDWNWLMEVVEKIESLGYEFIIAESRVNIAPVSDNSIEKFIIVDITSKKIEAVYNACVEFIKWYNEQNK